MQKSPSVTLGESLRLLRTRRFGTFWFASLLSNIGTWAQQVAEPWLLLGIGASPFLVGLDAFALDAPILLLTLAGGHLADHGDRRRVIASCQSLQMLCPLLVIALLLFGRLSPWLVIALSTVVGVTDALSMPSFQSIVPSIVAREQIGAGLALSSTQFNLSRILGPSLAGVLIGSSGIVGCFAVSAASYVPFILIALWILPHGRGDARAEAADGGRLLAGVKEIGRDAALRGALLTVFATSLLCGPIVTFAPVLVKQVFHAGASGFSVSLSAFGVGGLLGAIVLLAVDDQRDRRRISSRAACAYGLLVVLAALAPWFWSFPALLLLAGAAMTASNTSANTFLQSTAGAHLRGRTVSLYMLALRGGASLGSVVTGFTVGAFGVREALAIDGALAVAAHFAIGRRWCRPPGGAGSRALEAVR